MLTVTTTPVDVVVLPAASRATAVSVWLPLVTVVESQVSVYGVAVSSAPRLTLSSLNCTPTTAMLSAAVADTVTALPETVPAAGAVIETVGAVVSLLTVTATPVEVVVFPAASRATAVSVWLPFEAVVEFHVIEYGVAVSSAPRLTPSSLNWTPATATLSVAVAETVTAVPETVPAAGAVIDTVGAIESAPPVMKIGSTQ